MRRLAATGASDGDSTGNSLLEDGSKVGCRKTLKSLLLRSCFGLYWMLLLHCLSLGAVYALLQFDFAFDAAAVAGSDAGQRAFVSNSFETCEDSWRFS